MLGFTLLSCQYLTLDLIITESCICLGDFSGIYKPKETDAFQNTRKYPTVCNSIYITFDTEL